jgi:hypothetical protein
MQRTTLLSDACNMFFTDFSTTKQERADLGELSVTVRPCVSVALRSFAWQAEIYYQGTRRDVAIY